MRLVACLLVVAGTRGTQAESLCSLPPVTYSNAKIAHPASRLAIQALEVFGIATWYSDRLENNDYVKTAHDLVASCPEDSRLSVVVYGLPMKDCASMESAGGSTVHTSEEYVAFLTKLTSAIGNRKVLYILEPDAIGLMADPTGCGQKAGYFANLQIAIGLLSQNENAAIYLDVGDQALENLTSLAAVVRIVKQLATSGSKVKGIALNTSNYRATSSLGTLCTNFQNAIGSTQLHCIFDTSKNRNGRPTNGESCNVKSGGIGVPPTNETGMANVDYLLWVKPPGESDGNCHNRTSDSMPGPDAGIFFNELFTTQWNLGTLVKEMGYPPIGETKRQLLDWKTAINFKQEQQLEEDQRLDLDQDESTGSTTPEGYDEPTGKPKQLHVDIPHSTPAHRSQSDGIHSAEVLQVRKEDSGNRATGSGTVLTVGLVAAAVVSLAAVVGVRRKQQKALDERKTTQLSALAPLPNFRPQKTAEAKDADIL